MTEFREFIQIIGRGQRSGKTLSQQQAYSAMTMLLSGQASAEQRGAFLMLLRVREETSEELAGFTQACRDVGVSEFAELGTDLDMGCYAGKRRHLPYFLLAVMALAQTGTRIFLHGTHEPDSQRLYLDDVLQALELPICSDASQARASLDAFGFCYCPLSTVNPQLDELIQLRSQFGLRSCANTLARMLNPSSAPRSLQGVFHQGVDRKHAETALLLEGTQVLAFRGEGGELEYNPERAVQLHLVRGQDYEKIAIEAMQSNWVVKSKHLDAATLKSIWSGQKASDYASNAIQGTLAIMLMLAEVLSWPEALIRAGHIWRSRNTSWPSGYIPSADKKPN